MLLLPLATLAGLAAAQGCPPLELIYGSFLSNGIEPS
jgi:hypothetical protein